MRMDLEGGGERPWPMKVVLAGIRAYVGAIPAPPLAITYRPRLLHPRMPRYILRGVSASGCWSKGESELFAAFVSHLNTCHF